MARGGFDGFGHLTINGTPMYPLGVYDSGGGYFNDQASWVRQLAEHGVDERLKINLYLNYYLGGASIEATRALLNVLHARGISYLQTGNSFEGGSWRRMPFSISDEAYVRAFSEHPAALGYYLWDEPYDALIPESKEHHRQLKSWDPNGITFGALMAGWPSGSPTRTDPAMWINAADVLAVDPYPVSKQADGPPPSTYPHFMVGEHISKLRAVVPPARPIWAVLQLFVGMGGARLPTPEEMRYHVVSSIVEGAQGIMWWGVGSTQLRQDTDAATVEAYMGHLRALVTELAQLEPALLGPDFSQYLQVSTAFSDPVAGRIAQLERHVKADWLYSRKGWYEEEIAALRAGDTLKSGGMLARAGSIRTRATVAEGHGYVFAYNTEDYAVPATFTVPGVEPYHIKVWESRTPDRPFEVANGIAWSDTFTPYEAKIYVVGQ